MQKSLIPLLLPAILATPVAWSQTDSRTTGEASEIMTGNLREEGMSFKPLVGVVAYQAPGSSDTESRIAAGISLDANLTRWVNKDWSQVYVGPSTGIIYSHLGNPDSNLAGTDADNDFNQGGANLLIIPVDAKIGYTFGNARVAAHGGGNFVYRSIPVSVDTGLDSTDPDWSLFPNAGLDFEVGLSDTVALSLRPDWTFTNEEDVFLGTVGLGISLG